MTCDLRLATYRPWVHAGSASGRLGGPLNRMLTGAKVLLRFQGQRWIFNTYCYEAYHMILELTVLEWGALADRGSLRLR